MLFHPDKIFEIDIRYFFVDTHLECILSLVAAKLVNISNVQLFSILTYLDVFYLMLTKQICQDGFIVFITI